MMEQMVEVRCRGCRRLLGVAPADFRIYCDTMCATDYPATTAEGRDALIEAMFRETGLSKSALARAFGISRQRVDQIIDQRTIR